MSDQELVEIGKFGRAHGTRGEIRLWCYNPESPLFGRKKLVGVAEDESGARRPIELSGLRWSDRFAIVKVKGLHHRDQAEELINQRLMVPRGAFEALEEDELYLIDMIGWPVWVRQGEQIFEIGQVQGFLDTGAYDLMRVELRQGAGSWLVPVLDHCIVEMRQENARVVLAELDVWAVEGEDLPPHDRVEPYLSSEQAPIMTSSEAHEEE